VDGKVNFLGWGEKGWRERESKKSSESGWEKNKTSVGIHWREEATNAETFHSKGSLEKGTLLIASRER